MCIADLQQPEGSGCCLSTNSSPEPARQAKQKENSAGLRLRERLLNAWWYKSDTSKNCWRIFSFCMFSFLDDLFSRWRRDFVLCQLHEHSATVRRWLMAAAERLGCSRCRLWNFLGEKVPLVTPANVLKYLNGMKKEQLVLQKNTNWERLFTFKHV